LEVKGMTLKNIQSTLTVKDLPKPPAGKRGWPWTVGARLSPLRRADGSEWPRLSIVTPSYNQGSFLEATIRSVLLQGYPNLEYIVIDGGSSDESVEVLKKYDAFINYWVSEPDTGQTDAINKGLLKTDGKYLGWINSDDIYVKGTFAKVISAFKQNPESILVHGNRILIDAEDRIFGCSPLPAFDPNKTRFVVCSETAFWTRESMKKSGMLNSNLRFAMDLEFFGRLYLQGSFTKLDDYLGYFRCHDASKSSTIWHVAEEESIRVWKDLFGSDWPRHNVRRHQLRILVEFIRHPALIALPYFQNRISRKWFKAM
jgi:glycosyltransferase involved in cell wall biosynthesis